MLNESTGNTYVQGTDLLNMPSTDELPCDPTHAGSMREVMVMEELSKKEVSPLSNIKMKLTRQKLIDNLFSDCNCILLFIIATVVVLTQVD